MNKQTRKRVCLIPALAGILFSLAACGTAASAEQPPVETSTPATTTSGIEAFGLVESADVRSISIPVQADVARLAVSDGQVIDSTTALAEIDLSEPAHALALKDEEIASMQQDLAYTGASAIGRKSNLDKLRGDLAEAERQLAEALKEMERKAALVAQGLLPEQDAITQQNTVQAHRKAVTDARLAIEGEKANVADSASSRDSQVDLKSGQLRRLELERAHLEAGMSSECLRNSRIHSPMKAAVVTDIAVQEGDRIQAGQRLFTLRNLDALVVQADIPEDFVSEVKIGQKAEIVPLADKSRTYTGQVARIAGYATVRNGQTVIPVEISLDAADEERFLLPGFNVNVTLQTQP